MRINVMIEGQESVTWPQWRALAEATQAAGLEGLFRSDHYQSVASRTERSSLDAWATLAALGPVTERIRLGTMVSPSSFRHPSVLAKNVVTANHTSGGRVELGMGAGWHGLEHRTYGFDFHELGARYDVFEEQVEIVWRQFREERFDHHGDHYTLEACEARPKPVQDPAVPLILGGRAGPRSATLRHARGPVRRRVQHRVPLAAGRRRAQVESRPGLRGRRPRTADLLDHDRLSARP